MLRVVESISEVVSDDPVEILRHAYPALLATAHRLRNSPVEAEDLVQEALVHTLSKHPAFTGIERPLGYLRTVLFHLAFRARRGGSVEVPLELQERLEDPAPPPDDRILAEELVSTLPRRQRACVALRYLHGLEDEEIASVLGCRRSTVRSQIARGLETLRRTVGGVGDED
jgi:RNA polymerase sigma factor (sigma-70 family)